jgi:cytoskeletal protein CcmA (bactofilin family)
MTTIGASLIITGEVTSREDITINGQVKGQISMEEGGLLVGPNANVEAEFHGARVIVHGTFSGGIAASERVELMPTATVTGTLLSPVVRLQDGAIFNGAIEVERPAKGAVSRPVLAKAV